MLDSMIDGLLKRVRQQFPYTPPGDIYPEPQSHVFMWNLAMREGREQVIRWIAEELGQDVPVNQPHDPDVFSPQDRTAADTDARARSGPG